MNIIYAREEFPKHVTKSVFLAGPTLRSGHAEGLKSWREDCLKYLEELDYDGIAYVPEARDGKYSEHYEDQVEWEDEALNRADLIIFWLPRDMKDLPGLTTNDEWGHWKNFGKCVFGAPKDAEKVRYQIYYANKNNIKVFEDLKDLCVYVIDRLGDGIERRGEEALVPLEYWKHPGFQSWFKDLKNAGNRLDDFKVLFEWRIKHANNMLFSFCFWTKVWIESEQRHKENEYVFTRTNISSAVLYKPNENILDTDIVFIKEFRSPVSNSQGFVFEIPGGSSFKGETEAKKVIVEEIKEETGIEIDPDRLEFVQNRQLQSTGLSHKCFLFKAEITDQELIDILRNHDKTFGNIEDTEMTYVKVFKLGRLLESDIVDWSNVGMIFNAIYAKKEEK